MKIEKKLAQKIILIILSLVFSILIFKFLGGQGKRPVQIKVISSAGFGQPGDPPKAVVTQDAQWGRCPFSGRVYAPLSGNVKSIDLKLTGILWEENKASALINNSIFKEGDTIGSYILVKIKKNSVIVNDGNKEIELKLGQR